MRFWVLALSLLGFLVSSDAAKAGLSSTTRDPALSVEATTSTDEATQQTEDQIGLDKAKRRDVQRWLTGLGFDTKVNGRFDASTRAVITRWQAARGYPKTGFLNTLQHQALVAEAVSAAHADTSSSDAHRRGGGGAHHHHSGSGGGPGGLIGGVMGGLFGRR